MKKTTASLRFVTVVFFILLMTSYVLFRSGKVSTEGLSFASGNDILPHPSDTPPPGNLAPGGSPAEVDTVRERELYIMPSSKSAMPMQREDYILPDSSNRE